MTPYYPFSSTTTESSSKTHHDDASTAVRTLESNNHDNKNDNHNDTIKNYPFVYLYHYNGGTIGPTFMGSLMLKLGTHPVRHRILPLEKSCGKQKQPPRVVKLNSPITSRSEFVNLLASVANSTGGSTGNCDNDNDNNNNGNNDSQDEINGIDEIEIDMDNIIINNNSSNSNDDNDSSNNNSNSNSSSNNSYNSTMLFPTQRVAIQNEHGKFISCRRTAPTGGALAMYRDHIGEFEQFHLEHNIAKGTFSFKSHNQLYLHYNKALGTVAFKPKDMAWATWMVHPLGLQREEDQQGEHVIFVGVVEKNGHLAVQRTAEGVGPEWKTDFDTIIRTIQTEVPVGSCSMFQHPFTKHQWCFAKYDADTIGLVVSSERFPPSLATECHDDLTLWYKNSKDPQKLARIERLGLDLERITGKELAGLMMDYDEQYYASIRNTKLSKLEQDLLDLRQKMGQNIYELQNNIENVEALNAKAEDLLEMSRLFKKQTEKLSTSWKHATILVGAGIGAGAGALAGWLIGGPGGALGLGSEGLEIATGAAAVAILGGSIGATTTVSFWSRKFVRFVFPIAKSSTSMATKAKIIGTMV